MLGFVGLDWPCSDSSIGLDCGFDFAVMWV